ncbi:unnamed protein product, partial [Brugia timori]|uniref:Integrase catalytic domain-containing protein n=1 Tax=Brugia timori TaxID=42155 RepID=A0A0R3QF84_9BILA
MGPIKPVGTWRGSQYIVTFTDDKSRFTMAFLMKDKTNVAEHFEEYLNTMRSYIGDSNAKVFYFRTDGGREYLTDKMKIIFKNENIILEQTPPDTPQLNGVAERINRTLAEMVRSMLVDCGLPLEFWELALNQAVHVHNRMPHKSLGMKSPYEALRNRLPDLNYVYRFGCVVYRRIPYNKANTKKFGEKGQMCILMSCNKNSWEMLHVESGKVYRSSDIECTDSVLFKHKYPSDHFTKNGFPKFDQTYDESEDIVPDIDFRQGIKRLCGCESFETCNCSQIELNPNAKRAYVDDKQPRKLRKLCDDSSDSDDDEYESCAFLVGDRTRRAEKVEGKYFSMMSKLNLVPKSFKQAVESSNKEGWIKAINAELQSQFDNKTWT